MRRLPLIFGVRGLVAALFVLVWIALVPPVHGQNLLDGLTINGFGSWAYGQTNDNYYLYGNPDGDYSQVFAAVTFIGRVSDDVTIFVQPNFEYGDGVEVDLAFAFADWAIKDNLHLRAGRVRHPFGIYTEIYDVGTLRPFLNLPEGLYSADFVARGYNGLGLAGTVGMGGDWYLNWDVYGGEIDISTKITGFDQIFDNIVKNTYGGRVNLETPIPGFRFGASAMRGKRQESNSDIAPYPEVTQTVWNLFVEYLANGLSIRAEYGDRSDALPFDSKAAYAELAYMLSEHWQVAGRWDYFDANGKEIQLGPDRSIWSLLEHEDVAVAVNYWVNPKLVFKLEYHMVEGNRFAGPENFFELLYAGIPVEPDTDLIQFGVNFSF